MKKLYQMPEAMVCVLSDEDVIATSSLTEVLGESYGEDTVKWGNIVK